MPNTNKIQLYPLPHAVLTLEQFETFSSATARVNYYPLDNNMKILFVSPHSYIDFSNGASTATRDLLESLALNGHDCRSFTMTIFDYEQEVLASNLVSELNPTVRPAWASLGDGSSAPVFDFTHNRVRVTLQQTVSSRMRINSPSESEQYTFYSMSKQIFQRFKPDLIITYGGHPININVIALANSLRIPVVFHIHNFSYMDKSAFADTTSLLVPSNFCKDYYLKQLGVECNCIPLPINQKRVVVEFTNPQFLTFVNPVPEKGVTVFARIASEVGRTRPDIPILVVEGRRSADYLANVGLDLSHLTNLHRMENTSDPRDFYAITRVLLVPSLWLENAALVAREAMANGIPVLASNRGGLPEALGNAGFTFNIPMKCGPNTGSIPTSEEISPWVAAIARIWDDREFEAHHKKLARQNAKFWGSQELIQKYESYFRSLLRKP